MKKTIALYISIIVGAIFPLGCIILPFILYHLMKDKKNAEANRLLQRQTANIVNFQLNMFLFMFVCCMVFWYIQISAMAEADATKFNYDLLAIPLIIHFVFSMVYPLFMIVHTMTTKRTRLYYPRLIGFIKRQKETTVFTYNCD